MAGKVNATVGERREIFNGQSLQIQVCSFNENDYFEFCSQMPRSEAILGYLFPESAVVPFGKVLHVSAGEIKSRLYQPEDGPDYDYRKQVLEEAELWQ